MNSSNYDILRR
jgi:VanZ family protein